MCKLPPTILRLLAGMVCFILCSCFEIREEIWIEADGSGRAELSYVVPPSAVKLAGGSEELEAKIRKAIERQPELRFDGVETRDLGGRVSVKVRISTPSVMSLRNLDDNEDFQSMPTAAVDLAGKFEVHLRGLNVDFSRTIRVREALGLASFAIRGDDRERRRLRYIVHLPTPALETNASWTEDDGKTLVWDCTLGEALQQPVVTRFKARMPIPRSVWYAAGLIGLALIGLLLRIRAVRRRAKL